MNKQLHYPVQIKTRTDGGMDITSPDFPELELEIAYGYDPGEALVQSLSELIRSYIIDGKKIPAPSKIGKGEGIVSLPEQVSLHASLHNTQLELKTYGVPIVAEKPNFFILDPKDPGEVLAHLRSVADDLERVLREYDKDIKASIGDLTSISSVGSSSANDGQLARDTGNLAEQKTVNSERARAMFDIIGMSSKADSEKLLHYCVAEYLAVGGDPELLPHDPSSFKHGGAN